MDRLTHVLGGSNGGDETPLLSSDGGANDGAAASAAFFSYLPGGDEVVGDPFSCGKSRPELLDEAAAFVGGGVQHLIFLFSSHGPLETQGPDCLDGLAGDEENFTNGLRDCCRCLSQCPFPTNQGGLRAECQFWDRQMKELIDKKDFYSGNKATFTTYGPGGEASFKRCVAAVNERIGLVRQDRDKVRAQYHTGGGGTNWRCLLSTVFAAILLLALFVILFLAIFHRDWFHRSV